MASIADIASGFVLPDIQFSTAALSSTTASAGQLTGPPGTVVVMNNSGGTPGTYTTRTAAQMITDAGLSPNHQWFVVLCNGQGTGTLTLAGGSNVTVSGTATVATNTARIYLCSVNSAGTAITMKGLGVSMTATAFAIGA